ncbi:MAG: class I tRNA ligase family protein [Planctomycetes bacterium]|nr:class I tRNA ligase family protein [Planctomycetota bacterium]
MLYNQVQRVPDFPEMERRLLAFWKEKNIFGRLREQIRGNEHWSFLDGPITANNPMGVHHAWGRSYKDMFQRYHAMCGRDMRFQNGFDCQGLWVEVEVEKELDFKQKRDIVEYGLDKFTTRCKRRVLRFAARQTAQSIRLGYFMDWDDPDTLLALEKALEDGAKEVTVTLPSGLTVTDDPEKIVARLGSPEYGGSYFTFSTENNYTIWAFLKKCHDEGFIYRGTDVMPWCARCGTGISQMEVTEGRKITKHLSVFIKFPIIGRENESLLVWTTTPWTLTSNVAAAVNPEMTYLKVRHGDQIYYLGKENFERDRVQELEAGGKRETHKLHTLRNILKGSGETEVLAEMKGSELVGLKYVGPFDHLEAQQRAGGLTPYGPTKDVTKSGIECHEVIAWDEVSGAEGTGIVHIAPGCGAEDSRLGTELGLCKIAPLSEEGIYVEGFGEWTGRSVHSVAEDIAADLKTRGVLVAKESYPHVYPHCWRCKEELVFRLVDEWFIDMAWRDRIQKVVADIRWIPKDGEAREQDWLKNMGNWMISKKRFWGLALPIWQCEDKDCGWFTVVGSYEELRERATAGWDEFEGHTPHRPYVDAVKMKCEKCGGVASRVEDVGNPWLDAGIVPFSTVHFNTDPDYWKKWFPADFVVECFPGQFRNWFYALLAMSAMMDGRAPFKVLLGHALVRDENGEEMHKSKGNAIAFDDAAETIGAEVMRYIYAAQNPTQNLNFPDIHHSGDKKTHLDDEVRRKLLTQWNCYSFFVTYANVDGWKPGWDRGRPRPHDADDQSAKEGSQGNVSKADEDVRGPTNELDRWILSKLQHLIASAHEAFNEFAIYRLMASLEKFDDDFSNWYLRRSRRRFWKSESDNDKMSAYRTLYEVLTTLIRIEAPMLPFLTEEIYQNLVRSVDPDAPESIHLCEYPRVNEALIDNELERSVECVIRTKNAGLSLRNQTKVKIRQPLSKLAIKPRDEFDRRILQDAHFAQEVMEEINVKSIELIDAEDRLVSRKVGVNFKTVGPKYGKIMKKLGEALKQMDKAELDKGLAADAVKISIDGEDAVLTKEDLLISYDAPANIAALSDYGAFYALDTTLTEELILEGIARDFNRQAQDLRKSGGLEVSDRIRVAFESSDRVAKAVEAHKAWLTDELLADKIERVSALDAPSAKVGDETLKIVVEKS